MNNLVNFKQVLEEKIKSCPDRDAFSSISEKGELSSVTYLEYYNHTKFLGETLIDMGLQDSFIAVLGENRYEWVMPYMSVINGLGVIVPIDKELSKEEVANLLNRSKSKAFFYSAKYNKIVDYVKANVKGIKYFICMDEIKKDSSSLYIYDLVDRGKILAESGKNKYEVLTVDENKMTMLIYTSGTTGEPKGVMLCHRNVMTVSKGAQPALNLDEKDIALSILPLHHTYECTCGFLYMFYAGVKITFCRGLKYIVDDMKIARPTIALVVPLLLENIHTKVLKKGGTKVKIALKAVQFLKIFKIDIGEKVFKDVHALFGGQLATFVSGASALNPKIAKAFDTMGFTIIQGYGLTESAPLVTTNKSEFNKLASIGLPIPGVEIKIDNPDEEGIGELLVKGGNVMLGYYENQAATDEVIVDGWLYTGDYVRIDKDNFCFITGRKKNIIVTKNGKNIYPEEIEEVINTSDYILESIITTKEDDIIADTQIVALLVPNYDSFEEGTSKEDVIMTVKEEIKIINKKLPISKKIRDIAIFEEAFKKTSTKKIKRKTVEEVKYIGLS